AVACDEGRKLSEQQAAEEVERLSPLVKEDAMQVRRGLPEGAKKLSPMVDADTIARPVNLQRAIATARSQVKDLELAKSTFFAFADTTGTILRSEGDP